MKLNRVMWGIILLFVGIVLLLENFNVIVFYWRNVWSFWPVFLVISGINILFNKNKSQLGNSISLGVLAIMLAAIFYKGQQRPVNKFWIGDRFTRDLDIDIDQDKDAPVQHLNFTQALTPGDSVKKTYLNISGGGTSFLLEGATDSLITAAVERRNGNFILQKESSDSVNTVTFKMKDKKSGWSLGDGVNDVRFKLNPSPEWNLNMNMGAGEVNLDFSAYKLRSFRFDGGAASVRLKVGERLPVTDLTVKTGVADVEINIPRQSGCRIKTKTGLSAKDFSGFIKIDNGNYETADYSTSKNKIFINLDGGLSNFEVNRYTN